MRWLAMTTLTILGLAGTSHGSPADVFGLGSRAAGVGGAAAAWIDDFSAGHYNPAGIAFAERGTLTVGALGSRALLSINTDDYELPEPVGVLLGAAGPAPLHGPLSGRVHVGLGLYVIPQTILRITARLPDEPFYPYYDNRTQRLMVLPFLAVRVRSDLAVGLAVNTLAGVGGSVLAFQGPTRALEPRVDEEIPPRLRLNAGVRWQPAPAHQVALVFRQAFSVPFSTVADTEVAGEPLALDIRAEGLYTPDQVVAGYALRTGSLAAALDVTWARWSAYTGPYVRVTSDLPLVGALAGSTPAVPFRDTFGTRAGVEKQLGPAFVRGGWAFETSPVPAHQPGVTNLLDGPKHTFSLGLGWAVGRLRLDLHGGAQVVGQRTLVKRIAGPDESPSPFEGLRDEVLDNPNAPETLGVQISNPGYPSLDGGGVVLSAGLSVELAL
jgi:hypothetical protein